MKSKRNSNANQRYYITLCSALNIILAVIFACLVGSKPLMSQEDKRWWQREDPRPSASQILNPEYLAKKRQLERAWDIYQKDLEAEAYFSSLGQNTAVLQDAIRSSKRKVAELEEKLSSIPALIERTASARKRQVYDPERRASAEHLGDCGPIRYTFSEAPDESIIRVTFAPFPYIYDPHGIDLRSRAKLGDLTAYVLKVYPGETVNGCIEFRDEVGIKGTCFSDHWEFIAPSQAKGLLKEVYKRNISKHLSQGKSIGIVIDASKCPPYLDIPLYPGSYFIAYSLMFLEAPHPSIRSGIHLNYPGRSHDDCSVFWGPPRVDIGFGRMAQIEFRPTNNFNHLYYYHVPKDNTTWEGSEAYWDWIDFIQWSGHWDPSEYTREDKK